MEDRSSGLSLLLGRVLTAWCEQLNAPTLERYLETGGFQGLARSAAAGPLEVVGELRSSHLRDRGPGAEPAYLAWQRFSLRHGEGTLVVDARAYDDRSLSAGYLLQKNPFGLIEGLLMAAHAGQAEQVRLLLPPELHTWEAVLLNGLEMVESLDLDLGRRLQLELVREARPSIWSDGVGPEDDDTVLRHRLETWYHVALVLSMGAERYRTLGLEGQTGSWLMTFGGALGDPGLKEAPLGGSLWSAVETLAGGLPRGMEPEALALDGGMGGFLPVPAEGVHLAPEELAAAGVSPAPQTLWLLEPGTCLVDQTRRALYQFWKLSGEETNPQRRLIARALRMTTEVCRGKGREGHLAELEDTARILAASGLAAAWPLTSSLTHFRRQWEDHIAGRHCPSGRCLVRPPAPCHATCPANIDIPSFLSKIGHQDYKQAAGSIAKDNPLPYACGLVCPAPCEGACLRGEMDEPIQIRAMKAVAARHALDEGGYPKPRTAKSTGKQVAIVGSGPAGLACAYYLALRGHGVTVFEAQKEPGGMLRYGIPAYRLPREVLADELSMITRLGVEIKTETEVENIEQLRRQGFDSVYLALGTQLSRMIPIDGINLPFVLGGLDFLKEVRDGQNPRVGPRVVVVGGGNVSIDVALTALRQGGKRVDMFCLEKRREMPASVHEIEQAIHEGVAINNSWGPLKIYPDKKMEFQYCTRVFDDRGRFSPQFDGERIFSIEADHVIMAIGQATDLACVEQGSLVETERGLICADPDNLATREDGVFAGGDVVHGPQTVVMAIRAGKQGAAAIDAYLKGRPMDQRVLTPQRRDEVEPIPVDAERRTHLHRSDIPFVDVEDRRGNYVHVELGLDDDMAADEAARCLRCDLCIGCGLCSFVCSEVGAEALRLGETSADRLAFNDFTRPSGRCIGCGACSQVCPTGAIKVRDELDHRRTVITGSVVKDHPLIYCRDCGEPYVPQAYLDHLKKRVGPTAVEHVERGICPACARAYRSRELAGAPFYGDAHL